MAGRSFIFYTFDLPWRIFLAKFVAGSNKLFLWRE